MYQGLLFDFFVVVDERTQGIVRTVADYAKDVWFTEMVESLWFSIQHCLDLFRFLQEFNTSSVHLIDYFDQVVDTFRGVAIGSADMSWIVLKFQCFFLVFVGGFQFLSEYLLDGVGKFDGEVFEIRIGNILS